MIDYSEQQMDWFRRNGFTSGGCTYIIMEEDTYSIKEDLKERGCVYNKLLGWHTGSPKDIGSKYNYIPVAFDEIYKWISLPCQPAFVEEKEGANKYIEELRDKYLPTNGSWIGCRNQRFYNMPVTLVEENTYKTMYGNSNMYKFKNEDGNALVWYTKLPINLKLRQFGLLTGTCKDYTKFKGQKITRVTRCKIIVPSDNNKEE